MLTAALFALHGSPAYSQSTALSDLEQRATLLQDSNDIKRLQRIYGYYLDRSDWENVVALLTDDATAEYGGSGVYIGKSSIRKLLYSIGYDRAGLPPGLLREHIQFQPVVDVAPDGQTAKGRWRVFAILGQHGQGENDYARWQAGPYENEYRKESAQWKIAKLHAYFIMYTMLERGGWQKFTIPNTHPEKELPPDRGPTVQYAAFPQFYVPAFHFRHPATGKPIVKE